MIVPPAPRVPRLTLGMTKGELPDVNALFGLHVILVAFLHTERFVPRVDVTERRERADHAGRVRVGHHLLAQRGIALEGPPHLTPAEEHALLAGEAVDDGRRLAAERHLVRVEREQDAAEVGDVLAHRRAADDVDAGELRKIEALVLRAELRRLRLELR